MLQERNPDWFAFCTMQDWSVWLFHFDSPEIRSVPQRCFPGPWTIPPADWELYLQQSTQVCEKSAILRFLRRRAFWRLHISWWPLFCHFGPQKYSSCLKLLKTNTHFWGQHKRTFMSFSLQKKIVTAWMKLTYINNSVVCQAHTLRLCVKNVVLKFVLVPVKSRNYGAWKRTTQLYVLGFN